MIEASVEGFWRGYTGLDGKVLGMNSFGESALAAVLFEHFGFTQENALSTTRALLKN